MACSLTTAVLEPHPLHELAKDVTSGIGPQRVLLTTLSCQRSLRHLELLAGDDARSMAVRTGASPQAVLPATILADRRSVSSTMPKAGKFKEAWS